MREIFAGTGSRGAVGTAKDDDDDEKREGAQNRRRIRRRERGKREEGGGGIGGRYQRRVCACEKHAREMELISGGRKAGEGSGAMTPGQQENDCVVDQALTWRLSARCGLLS